MTHHLSPETCAAIQRMLEARFRLAAQDERLTLSDWAERYFELDADSSHKTGQWACWTFQRALMDWMSDDRIVRVIIKKSKRVGYTKILTALLCYYAVHLRRKAALWQPTDDDRDSFVRTELEPLLDQIQAVREARRRAGSLDTLKLKQFLGSIVHLLGGKAARAFRRITVALSVLDEWSAFDQSVEGQGDPGSLAFGRLEGAPYPKFVGGSTPGTRGACHVTLASEQADVDMSYHITCPHCGVEHPLTTGWAKDGKRTRYGLQWEPGKPATVVHVCPHCLQPMTRAQYLNGGALLEGEWVCIRTGLRYTRDRRWVDAAGLDVRPPKTVAAQVWSAYSPQRDWVGIAEDHERAAAAAEQGDDSLMITLVNETYGEAYEVQGQRVDEGALARQAGKHTAGIVPVGGLKITAGVDVQADRVEIGVWAWGRRMESWSIEHQVIHGNPAADDALWLAVGDYLRRQFIQAWNGRTLGIESVSIDSGYATHAVYWFVRALAGTVPVRAIKGRDEPKMPIRGPATPQDINFRGKRLPAGIKLWHIGTQASEDLLHGQLSIDKPGPGFIHVAEESPPEWYSQLTGKKRVPVRSDRGIVDRWVRVRPRVEVRDCRRYAHHAALCLGLEAYSEDRWRALESAVQPPHDLFSRPPEMPVALPTQESPGTVPPAAHAALARIGQARPVPRTSAPSPFV